MAWLLFTKAEVAGFLNLPNTEAVEELILVGALTISAYTRTGRPLFTAEVVMRAAKRPLGDRAVIGGRA